jgi:hypothetical protein
VAIPIFPEVAFAGTVAPICVLVALVTAACVVLKVTLSLARMSKFVPVMETAVPGVPMFGVKLIMEGTPEPAETVKFELLETEPAGVPTLMGPVVAPAGTVTTRRVADAETMLAVVPLNCTVFCEAVALNAVPLMVTVAPAVPLCGVKEIIASCDELCREMLRMFPTASYLYVAESPAESITPMSLPNSS